MDGDINTQELKSLIEKMGKTWEDYKSANDQRLAQIERKGAADVVTEEQVKKLNDEINRIEDTMKQGQDSLKKSVSEIEKLAARPRGEGAKDALSPEEEAYAKSFSTYVRKGDDRGFLDHAGIEIKGMERKDGMTVVGDPTGGYFVPPTYATRIIKKVYETSPMRQYATVMTTTGDEIEFPSDPADIDAAWVGETGARSDTTGLAPGKNRIPVFESYAQPKVTQKLLDDAFFDVEAYLGARVGDRLARLENAAFVNGDGVSQPRGFTTEAVSTSDDSSRAWGTLQYTKTGVNGDFAASTPADLLFTIVQQMKVPYLEGSIWATTREVVGKIRQFKSTTNGYIWQPALSQAQPATLLGYPVAYFQDMDALSSNGYSLAFANFMEGYTIVDRLGLRMLRDPYTAKPYVRFYTTKRVGGKTVNSEAIKLVKFSA